MGHLRVTTSPEDAKVRILHRQERFSQGMALPAGVYVLEAQRAGYAPVRREVTILPGEEASCHLALAEAPAQGQLFVKTRPEGATVRVVNIKPVFEQGMALAPGTYQLDAFLEGYHTAAASVAIAPGEQTTVTIDLAPSGPQGRLFVQTEPAGAMVRVLDIAPRFRQGMLLEAGSYTLSASLPGHESVTVQADIRPGQDNSITVQLPQAAPSGKLFVDGLPAGGKVRVMTVRPEFSQGMGIAPGEHALEIALPGKRPIRHIVTILPGQTLRVQVPALLATRRPQRLDPATAPKPGEKRAAKPDGPAHPGGAVLTQQYGASDANASAAAPATASTTTGTPLAASPAGPPAIHPGAMAFAGVADAKGAAPALASEPSPEAVTTAVSTANGGRLFVHTAPNGADIRIIHASWSAPAPYAEGMFLPEGLYGVSAFMEGYDPVLERVQVLPGKSTQLHLDFAGAPHESAALISRRTARR